MAKWSVSAEVRLLFRSDHKRALVTLTDEAVARVKQKGIHVETEECSRYDSRSNGLVESGVKAVKDKVRTLILATNAAYGIKLDGNHVLMPYLVRYCGSMLSRCVRRSDGRTAFERRKGRSVQRGFSSIRRCRACSIVCQRRRSRQLESRSGGWRASSYGFVSIARRSSF